MKNVRATDKKRLDAIHKEDEDRKQRRDEDLKIVRSRLKLSGSPQEVKLQLLALGLGGELVGALATILTERETEMALCIEAKKHWQPKTPPVVKTTPGEKVKYPRCKHCHVRVDVPLDKDEGLIARAAHVVIDALHEDVSSLGPSVGQLRSAGFFKPEFRFPGKIEGPWKHLIAGCKHDLVALEASVRLARTAGAVTWGQRHDAEEPEVLAVDRNEHGRRWSF